MPTRARSGGPSWASSTSAARTARRFRPGTVGTVYFEQPTAEFQYHKDSDQTRTTRHPKHPNWTALGDIGHVDADGYLYLTDRATFTIIAGGVNIYPQEIEDCLIIHPLVDDVAVFGVPNDDLGEEVKAVVQLAAGVEPGEALEEELIAWTQERLSLFKCPRSIDFDRRAAPAADRQALQAGPAGPLLAGRQAGPGLTASFSTMAR